jgi:hypothetical protein
MHMHSKMIDANSHFVFNYIENGKICRKLILNTKYMLQNPLQPFLGTFSIR